mgnify:CR=1 FL=1
MYGTNLSYVWEKEKKSFIFNDFRLSKQNKELNKNNNKGSLRFAPKICCCFLKTQRPKPDANPPHSITPQGHAGERGDTLTGTVNDMSSCQRAKPFTGLANGFPPVVGLAPDPAAFSSSRLSGPPLLTKNQRGRALDGASQASSRSRRERALGTIGADNGGERVPCQPSLTGGERAPSPTSRQRAGAVVQPSPRAALQSGRSPALRPARP